MEKYMEETNNFIQDLMIIFGLDLLNNFEQVGNSIVITMEDNSKVKVVVRPTALNFLS